jgi:hypothetical protein
VAGVVHERCADRAGVLQRAVRPVVAAHEADLHQPAAGGGLRVDDGAAGPFGGREGLLAEDRLAGGDAGQHVLLVGGSPGGDEDGVDVLVRDHLGAAGVHDGVLQPGGDLLRQVGIEVGDGGDLRAREHVGDPADVVLADHAGAHDSDSNCHAIPFRYGQRRTGPSPQAV